MQGKEAVSHYNGISKKPFCIANKQGFVSVYALAVLCIILSFVSYCVMRSQTTALLKNQNKQHLIELYCIHQVKDQLKMMPLEKQDPDQEKLEDTENKTPQENINENRYYQGSNILFTYTEEAVDITYNLRQSTFQMHIKMDEQHEIQDIQYTSA